MDDRSDVPDDPLEQRARIGLARLVEYCFKQARTRADVIDRLGRWASMTADERLIQQGEARGLQQGREQGFRQGEKAALLRMLRNRFGNQVDNTVEQRVEAASAEEVGVWMDRFMAAATLAELMAS